MAFKSTHPEAADLAHLDAKRTWVRDHYDECSRHKYEDLAGKLQLMAAILSNGWIKPDETVKLQSLGVTLGDALVQHLGLEWAAIEDEVGRDLGLVSPGTTIRVWPMTALCKRVERGEVVDVYDLFRFFCETVERLRLEAE